MGKTQSLSRRKKNGKRKTVPCHASEAKRAPRKNVAGGTIVKEKKPKGFPATRREGGQITGTNTTKHLALGEGEGLKRGEVSCLGPKKKKGRIPTLLGKRKDVSPRDARPL